MDAGDYKWLSVIAVFVLAIGLYAFEGNNLDRGVTSITGNAVLPNGQNISTGCVDTDNGKTYNVYGNVTYSKDGNNYCLFKDNCIVNSNVLKEFYCYQGMVRYTYYDCAAAGCSAGRCNP
jgi:hypothetical protein